MTKRERDKELFLKSYKFPKEIVKWARQNIYNLKVGEVDKFSDKSIEYAISPCRKFILKRPETILGKKPKYAIPTKYVRYKMNKRLLLQPFANLRRAESQYYKIISKFGDSRGKVTGEKRKKMLKLYGGDFHSGNVGVWKRRIVSIDW